MSDPSVSIPDDSPIVVSSAPLPLTVEYAPRRVTMHYVSNAELDTIANASLNNSLNLALFGLCFGAIVSCLVVLTTTMLSNPVLHTGYVGALIVSSVMGAFFGIRAAIDRFEARKKLKEIKAGR